MPITEIKKSGFYEISKRILDIIFALTLIIIFSPVILIVSIAIKLDSQGPILADTPERVGKRGIGFKMFKFRSMVANAHQLLRDNPKYSDLFERYKNSKSESRFKIF